MNKKKLIYRNGRHMTLYMQTVKALIVVSDLNKEVNSEIFKSAGVTELFWFVKCPTNGEDLQKDITKLCKKKFWVTKAPGNLMQNSLLRATECKDTGSGLEEIPSSRFLESALTGALLHALCSSHVFIPHEITAVY